jgi:putative ABC transport system permease protein
MTVIGVVGDFRADPRRMPAASDTRFQLYTLWRPPAPEHEARGAAPAPQRVDTGGSYGFITVTVRMDSTERAAAVRAAVARLDPRLRVEIDLVDDIYAEQHVLTLVAVRVVGAFSAVGFLVAMAGLYSVMAFLVATRTREIGIRMALGADRRDITRMVIASSGTVVLAGVVSGSAIALGLGRWLESQLFGVSAADPATHIAVASAVVLTAFAATWQPARQAARVEPAVTLRAE